MAAGYWAVSATSIARGSITVRTSGVVLTIFMVTFGCSGTSGNSAGTAGVADGGGSSVANTGGYFASLGGRSASGGHGGAHATGGSAGFAGDAGRSGGAGIGGSSGSAGATFSSGGSAGVGTGGALGGGSSTGGEFGSGGSVGGPGGSAGSIGAGAGLGGIGGTSGSGGSGTTEVCDGRDNNGNGQADEDFACVQGTRIPCLTTCGSWGYQSCREDCTLGTCVPPDELCNGRDDDCDGVADNGDPGSGPCATGLLGVCTEGTAHCLAGKIVCEQNTPASAEVCDGLDNDCNGVIDEVTFPIFSEGFETGTGDWSLDLLWSWSNVAYAGTGSLRGWWTNNTVGCTVTESAFMNVDVDVTGVTRATLEFRYQAALGSFDSLSVFVSTDGGVTWSEAASIGALSSWGYQVVSLTRYLGGGALRVGFQFFNGCGDSTGVDWRIDEIVIRKGC